MRQLLAISLGPVQGFIAAARRTGDLRAGSRLLVEVSKAAAQAVHDADGVLIFPADRDTDGPNRILAEMPHGGAEEAAAAAETAAQVLLRERWAAARDRLRGGLVDHALADRQIAAFLEFAAAWWPMPSDEDYRDARRDVERLLAGRKALRDFEPAVSRAGLPKSPLDPSLDTVVQIDTGMATSVAARRGPLWLKARETLDAVSLLKRLDTTAVPSTSRMAVEAILPVARERAPAAVAALEAIANSSGGAFDLGDLFFRERLDPDELDAADVADSDVERHRKATLEAAGCREAPPYYALLVADGDRMGPMIGRIERIEEHRALSQALAGFAAAVRGIVEARRGCLVYSGGDDVLALLPAPEAIACAAELAHAFRDRMTPAAAGGAAPTLSAGLALVHHLEPLQTSLERARAAERTAKVRRNSLAVALHTRGGAPLTVSLGWDAERARDSWTAVTAAFAAGLARGLPYELRELAREWRGTDLPEERMRAEASRIIGRKEGGEHLIVPDWVSAACDLARFANLLGIARFLAAGGPGGDGAGHEPRQTETAHG